MDPLTLFEPPAQVRHRQDALVRATMQRVLTRHPHYRERFRGLEAETVDSVDALARLPLTTKDEYAADPERFRLEPDPADPLEQLWDVAYSGGSTARPTPVYQTGYDFQAILLAQRRMAEIRGMRPDDRIANLYPLTAQAHGAWLRANAAAAVLGCELVVGMSGAQPRFPVTRRLPEVAALLVRRTPTVLWGVPSYLHRVVGEVSRQGGRLSEVRLLAVSGEPCPPETAAALRAALADVGADAAVSNSLGATELQCGLVECAPGTGFHNPAPELFHLSAVDDGGLPVDDGRPGRLCVTHLDRRGTVLIRYLLGDVVVLAHDICPRCGRSGGRVVEHLGRSGSRTKVRGQLVDQRLLLAALDALDGLGAYQVRVRQEDPGSPASMDELVVAVQEGADAGLEDRVRDVVRAATGVRPVVERVPAADIHDPHRQFKRVRFVDERTRPSAGSNP